MGCCVSTSSAPYPPQEGNSSSRAITSSQPQSQAALPRPSTHASSHSNRPQAHSQPLSAHINRPLKPHIWTSNQQLWNRTELDRERDEFFDTRVTGRPEIWQTIRVALEVLWKGGDLQDTDRGFGTAQSILTAADITIPSGDMAGGVYDSFGAYYQLPEHIVSDPVNLAVVPPRVVGGDDKSDEAEQSEEELRRREEKGKGVMIELKARLSDNGGADIIVKIGKDESVRLVTRRIFEASGHAPPKHIKLAYRGKLLAPQHSLMDQGWQEGHVVNAMVFD